MAVDRPSGRGQLCLLCSRWPRALPPQRGWGGTCRLRAHVLPFLGEQLSPPLCRLGFGHGRAPGLPGQYPPSTSDETERAGPTTL